MAFVAGQRRLRESDLKEKTAIPLVIGPSDEVFSWCDKHEGRPGWDRISSVPKFLDWRDIALKRSCSTARGTKRDFASESSGVEFGDIAAADASAGAGGFGMLRTARGMTCRGQDIV
jgi:hypothetical protein